MPFYPVKPGRPLRRDFEHMNVQISNAYDCASQEHVNQHPGRDEKKRTETLVQIRLLGYMLTHLSDSDEVTTAVVGSILSLHASPPTDVEHVGREVSTHSNTVALIKANWDSFYQDFLPRPCEYMRLRVIFTPNIDIRENGPQDKGQEPVHSHPSFHSF